MINIPAVLSNDGHEIVPIRAIPFVTGDLTALDVARLLADPEHGLTAHVLDHSGGSSEMRPKDWAPIVASLLSRTAAGYCTQIREQLELLPSSTFVQWEGLWRTYERCYLPDRSELTSANYTPVELANFALHRDANIPNEFTNLVFAGFLQTKAAWTLTKPKRFQGYTEPLYLLLEMAHIAGQDRPNPRAVLQAFAISQPSQIEKIIQGESLDYFIANGSTKTANLKAIQAVIVAMTGKS